MHRIPASELIVISIQTCYRTQVPKIVLRALPLSANKTSISA